MWTIMCKKAGITCASRRMERTKMCRAMRATTGGIAIAKRTINIHKAYLQPEAFGYVLPLGRRGDREILHIGGRPQSKARELNTGLGEVDLIATRKRGRRSRHDKMADTKRRTE